MKINSNGVVTIEVTIDVKSEAKTLDPVDLNKSVEDIIAIGSLRV